MADIQKQFEQFHETIRVDYDMADELREKRDIVLERLNKYLKDKAHPLPRVLLQGSYKMKTGTQPIAELEYDIDIGLRFDFHEDEYSTLQVRKWVYDAVKDHTMRVDDKGPCIRVCYEKGFHLDLVVYAVWEGGGTEQYRLAHKTRGWRPANPPALLEYVDRYRESFKGTKDNATKTDQFRRCVRYLRRWNDVCVPFEHEEKACGLAFILLAVQRGLRPAIFIDDRPDDRAALERFTNEIAQTPGRLEAKKPTPEHEDMFGRISEAEMKKLKERFAILRDRLREAGRTADPVRACELLAEVLGEDFPVPQHVEVAQRSKAPAIITSSRSA
jgi:hypothetical protein